MPLYAEKYRPTVLRWNRSAKALGLETRNIKASKGYEFDRVLISPLYQSGNT